MPQTKEINSIENIQIANKDDKKDQLGMHNEMINENIPKSGPGGVSLKQNIDLK